MSFWSGETLGAKLPTLIGTFSAANIKESCYELAMGPEVFVTGHREKRLLKEQEQVIIPPGQSALLLTEETIEVPDDAMAFISVRTKAKYRGLTNVSGFHVDPGFKGRLVFSVHNAGVQDIAISRGQRLFLIWFASLDRKTAYVYKGTQQHQMSIPDEFVEKLLQGEFPTVTKLRMSLDEMKQQVSDLRSDLKRAQQIGLYITGAVVLAFVVALGAGVATNYYSSLFNIQENSHHPPAPLPATGSTNGTEFRPPFQVNINVSPSVNSPGANGSSSSADRANLNRITATQPTTGQAPSPKAQITSPD